MGASTWLDWRSAAGSVQGDPGWLKTNGESLYGARPTPFGEELGEPTGEKGANGQPLFKAADA